MFPGVDPIQLSGGCEADDPAEVGSSKTDAWEWCKEPPSRGVTQTAFCREEKDYCLRNRGAVITSFVSLHS